MKFVKQAIVKKYLDMPNVKVTISDVRWMVAQINNAPMSDGLSPAKIMFGYTVAEKDTVDFLSDAFFRNSPYAEERKNASDL